MTEEQLNTGFILKQSIEQCSTVISTLGSKSLCVTIELHRLDNGTRDALLTFFRDRRNYLEEKFKEL